MEAEVVEQLVDEDRSVHRAAIVVAGCVANVIVVHLKDDGTPDFELPGSDVHVLSDDSLVQTGWLYHDNVFVAPEDEEVSEGV